MLLIVSLHLSDVIYLGFYLLNSETKQSQNIEDDTNVS